MSSIVIPEVIAWKQAGRIITSINYLQIIGLCVSIMLWNFEIAFWTAMVACTLAIITMCIAAIIEKLWWNLASYILSTICIPIGIWTIS